MRINLTNSKERTHCTKYKSARNSIFGHLQFLLPGVFCKQMDHQQTCKIKELPSLFYGMGVFCCAIEVEIKSAIESFLGDDFAQLMVGISCSIYRSTN